MCMCVQKGGEGVEIWEIGEGTVSDETSEEGSSVDSMVGTVSTSSHGVVSKSWCSNAHCRVSEHFAELQRMVGIFVFEMRHRLSLFMRPFHQTTVRARHLNGGG